MSENPPVYTLIKAAKKETCSQCRKPIPETTVMMTISTAWDGSYGTPMPQHLTCVTKGKVVDCLKQKKDDITEVKGFGDLTHDEQQDTKSTFEEIMEGKAEKKTTKRAASKKEGGATKKAKKEPKEKKAPKEKKEKKAKEPKEPKEKKGKKKKDADALPKSAYMLFTKLRRPGLTKEYPSSAPKDIMRLLGAEWKEMDADKKAEYKAQFDKLKEEYKVKEAENKKSKGDTDGDEANGNGNGHDGEGDAGDGDSGKEKKKAPAKKRAVKKKSGDEEENGNDEEETARDDNDEEEALPVKKTSSNGKKAKKDEEEEEAEEPVGAEEEANDNDE